MKRTISLIALLLVFAMLFSACVGQPMDIAGSTEDTTVDTAPTTEETVGNTQPSTEETVDSTEPSETVENTEPVNIEDIEGPLAQYVQTAIKETHERFDVYGNMQQMTSLRIPKLLPFSEDAVTAQAEIQNKLDSYITEVRTDYAEGNSSSTEFVDYNAYLNDTIFSVAIQTQSVFDSRFYLVYNFDIETGKQLNTEELMNKLQITDYTEKFTQIAQDAFSKQWGEERDTSSHDYDLYVSQKAKNSSKENIDKAMPYVAEDGKVMVVLDIYSLAGAEKYPQVLPVS